MDIFSTGLTFDVENLGSVRRGSFALKPLTIFCGPNNSGKTWAMYSLYRFFELLRAWKELPEKPKPDFNEFNRVLSDGLADLFNAPPEELSGARFAAKLPDKPDWPAIVEQPAPNVFLMPAERSGLHLFFHELTTRRTALLHHASRESVDINALLRGVIRSRYAAPIARYIDWLNELVDKQKFRSESFHAYAERLKKDLAGGAYKVDARTGGIDFRPYSANRNGKKTAPLRLHMTSGTVKSLFGLWFYLEHEARPGGVLMIDEPELNIHPENQLKIARFLARLVNAGLHIVISTHSDYIVREINSMIMLDRDEKGKLRRKYRYKTDEILQPEQVGAYLFEQQTIEPFKITSDNGIHAVTFNKVIRSLNTVNNDIYYTLQEQYEQSIGK